MNTKTSFPSSLGASYIENTLNDLIGEPALGKLRDSSKTVTAAQVPERYKDLVQAVADRVGKNTITGKDLDEELWKAQQAIEKQDKTFGIHLDGAQPLRALFGIGGNGRIEPKEAGQAARKNPVASALLSLIARDLQGGTQGSILGSVG